jgi:hypothetical protein
MHYIRIEEYPNGLELLSTALKLRAVGSNPRGVNCSSFFNSMYVSILKRKKVFNFDYIINMGVFG